MDNSLEADRVRVGMLIDDVEGTPYQQCTLTRDPSQGALLSVPYVNGVEQFELPSEWFEFGTASPPESLLFADPDGHVTLTGLRFRGARGLVYSLGRLDARVAIFGQPRKLQREYRVKTLRSRLDGLHHFAAFESIDIGFRRKADRFKVRVTLDPKDVVEAKSGSFTLAIRATAPWDAMDGIGFTTQADAELETTCAEGATVDEHIQAQWAVRALLSIVQGTQIRWRAHKVLDHQFPTWMLDGHEEKPSFVNVLYQRTAGDFVAPVAETTDLRWPAIRLADLGAGGLQRWLDLYSQPLVRRAVEPAVEVINGATRFVEPRLLMTVLGLDAMGYFRDDLRKPKTPLHMQIERCLLASGLDVSALGSVRQVATAIAHVNNDIKHPDRDHRPDGIVMRLVADLALLVMRMQTFELLGVQDKFRPVREGGMPAVVQAFERNGVAIRDERFLST
ncbi:hypothetical protein [Terrabacter carboxydivorans]|uniref:ApeA N-terminal domain-containing protein n=1 Tax=Terrabacter carboxydivorans TaxID=619730 RepID=A0ABN3LYH9_9MICO